MFLRILFINLLAVTLCLPFTSAAQQFYTEKYGETGFQKEGVLPVGIKDGFLGMDIDAKAKFGYTLKLNKVTVLPTLIKYDKSFNVIMKKQIYSDTAVFGPVPPSFLMLNNHPYLLYFKPGEDFITINLAEIDADSLTLKNSKIILIINPKNVGLSKTAALISNSKFMAVQSPDKKYAAFFWNSSIDNKFTYSVTDQNFDVVRTNTQSIEKAEEIKLNNILVDNAGNLFGSIYEFKHSKRNNYLFNSPAVGAYGIRPIESSAVIIRHVFLTHSTTEAEIKINGTFINDDELITGAYVSVPKIG